LWRGSARSDSLSEPERLFIKSHYHYIVTGGFDDVVAAYRLWIGTYPDDWVPHNNLSATYVRLNQVEPAIEEGREAVRLGPNAVVAYQQLTRALLAADRIAEANEVIRDATSKGLVSSVIHMLGYDLAFIARDAAGMQEHLRAAATRADSYVVLTEAARAAYATGDLEASRTLYAQAVTAARSARVTDIAGSLIAEQALSDALTGDTARGLEQLRQAITVSSGPETMWPAALAASFLGRAQQAAQFAQAYQDLEPPAPDIVGAHAPMAQAAVALGNGDGRRALALLNTATPFDRTAGPWLPYLRGLSYLNVREYPPAADEFRTIIARPGGQPTNLVHTLARLQLARAAAGSGDIAEARQAYTEFASIWRAADARHPLRAAAAAEAAALASTPPATR
jgi:tetratricopeptide (TPR) repeat protein